MVAVFDLVGTLFRLDTLSATLEREGAPPDLLHCWFPELLQTAMAATLADAYISFREAAELSLTNLLERRELPDVSVGDVMAGFKELEPYEDACACLEELRGKGIRCAVLTNSSRDAAVKLLDRGGLLEFFEAVISADEVARCKPHHEPYRLALDRLDAEPEEAWLIAAHGWDIIGGAAIGMRTVWVARGPGRWPFSGEPPGRTVLSLAEVPGEIR